MHLTGIYPEWWKGHRFKKPIRAWFGGVTNLTTRDVIQRKLMGSPGEIGTGWVPAERINKLVPSRGVSGAYDYALVKHSSGGMSFAGFKSYEQGREKWMADEIDLIHCDEEPPFAIWTEALARITATKGIIFSTFTPLKGMSEMVRGFYPHPDSHEKSLVRMELVDARHEDGTGHISDSEIAKILDRYPAHEKDARTKGIPILGSGLVYGEIPEEMIVEDPPELQAFWARISGLDLGGGDHPTAWTLLAHDRELDVLHLLHTYKGKDPRIAVHAAAINSVAPGVPVAWPHDAHTMDRGDGIKFADMYRRHGVAMLAEHAHWLDQSNPMSVEAGIAEIYNRMVEGRFKAAYMHTHFWDEFRLYHRVKGVVVKQFDDTLASIRYAVMMLRFARRVRQRGFPTHARSRYDPLAPRRMGGQERRVH